MSGSDVLTLANQLTLLRMFLIPAFVVLVIEGELGWALVVFGVAGITDALDGVIARRSGQKTTLGAWLDPMADKLMLVSAFVVLTLPGLGLANRLPIWLTALIISRDVCIVVTVAIYTPVATFPYIDGRNVRRPTARFTMATVTTMQTSRLMMSAVSQIGRRFARPRPGSVSTTNALTSISLSAIGSSHAPSVVF